jgi:hypothetical protein
MNVLLPGGSFKSECAIFTCSFLPVTVLNKDADLAWVPKPSPSSHSQPILSDHLEFEKITFLVNCHSDFRDTYNHSHTLDLLVQILSVIYPHKVTPRFFLWISDL